MIRLKMRKAFTTIVAVCAISGAFFMPAYAQWQVTNHTIPIGRGAGTGFKSLSLGNNEIPVGQTSADPVSKTATGWFDAAYCNTVGYVIARLTGAWTCAQGIPVNITWYGADPTGVADSTTAIRNAIAAAGVNTVYCSQGTYRITGAITSSTPIHFYGPSHGAGPGALLDNGSTWCRLLVESSGADVFHITSPYPSTFRDFMIRKTNGTTGIGINLDSDSTPNTVFYQIKNVAIVGVDIGIRVLKPGWGQIQGVVIKDWRTYGVQLETVAGVESAGGFISGVFDAQTGTPGPAIYSEVAYTVLGPAEITGGDYGVWFNYKNSNAGFTQIIDSSIENQRLWNIRLSTADGSVGHHVFINRVETGGDVATMDGSILVDEYPASPAWLKNFDISNTVLGPTLGAGDSFLWMRAGQNVNISNTKIVHVGAGNPIGINLAGVTTNAGFVSPIFLYDNQITGTTNKYAYAGAATGGAAPVVRDMQGTTFAQITSGDMSVAGNGSLVYVTDGLAGSNPLAGGGTGTLAFRENGVWIARGSAVMTATSPIVRTVNDIACPTCATTLRTPLPLVAAAGLTGGSTSYFVNISSTLAGASEANVSAIAPIAGTFKNFYISVSTAPTAGQNIVFTLRVNGSDTAVTCTITDTATACNDTTHTAAITAGQAWSVKAVYSATAATSYPIGGIEYSIP